MSENAPVLMEVQYANISSNTTKETRPKSPLVEDLALLRVVVESVMHDSRDY